ncbi:amino acid adenylation domain-containing protein [Streptomyces sp. P1-3]|uniref:amino acid adenylation domain-containing protein n=1 Tax=Streptomyces sp. P1-3 TaxID=3421658 RepID=UPI003D35CF76
MNHALPQGTASATWPPALMPTDRPRRPGTPPRCTAVARAELDVPAQPFDRPREEVLLAGFAALLHRYTEQDRIVLDVVDRTDATRQARLPVTGARTLRELARDAAADRVAGTDGPSPVGISFPAPGAPAEAELPGELRLVVRAGDEGPAGLELHYDAGLFDADTAARMLDHYVTLLEDGTRHPDREVARLRLLTDAELRRMLVEWNRTEADLPHDVCLHEAFETWADRSPEAVAVVHGAERWTYGRVNAAANRLAHHLRSLGVGPDVRVGLCLDRSPELLVCALGILKAGGAYVPIDPAYPTQRIATMVEGTSCAAMISREGLTGNLPDADTDGGAPLVLIDRDADLLAAQPEHNPEAVAGPENLLYIIHTSGSTGTPKPIALCHRGVMNNIADLNTRFQVGPGDSVLAISSPSFDMSAYEFLGMTTAGATVVVPDRDRTMDPAHWTELLLAEGVTVWNSAPALLDLLVDHLEQTGAGPLPTLRVAILGGDWVPVTLFDRIRKASPALRFIPLGGAAEVSIHSTFFEVEEVDPEWTSIPYGRPMANQRAYILDDALQPVPQGVTGELYYAGVGLGRGYLDQPERTAERFLQWSHGEVSERLYRTGDMARFGADGLIELIGRRDFQVKINGMRVELGEIESVLRSHPKVQQTAVVARSGRLVAYVVPVDGVQADDLDLDELRSLAVERLPEYMVPNSLVALPKLPLTPNGKLDRKGLPEPDVEGPAYRAPRTAEERALAEVYAEVLGRDRIGLDDDFIVLGGDSIRSIQVVTRARTRGIEITPRHILRARTVAELALAATRADATADAAEDTSAPLVTAGQDDLAAWRQRYPGLADVWPLTPMQSGMLFESMLSGTGYDAYRMQTLFHLSGPVDAARMRAAGQALLDRYANLRTAFVPDAAGQLVQLVVDGVELPWREADLGGVPDAEREEALRRFLAEDQAERFDLAEPPLLRLTLVGLGPDRSVLVLTAHHALIDGWSEQIIARDLLRLYAAEGGAPDLAPVRGYRDFLAWLARQDAAESSRAWAEELSGVDEPTVVAPVGASRAEVTGTGEVVLTLSAEESARLARCCSALGVTSNTLVQGAWAVLLSALTGRTDVVFGATVSGRSAALAGVESMVGLFINTVPVRARCAPGDTRAELLTRLQSRQTDLLDHHHHSLADIHQAAGVDALFDTLVVFQSYPADHEGDAEAAAAAGIAVTGVDSLGAANYPLTLIVEADRLTLQYHRHVFGQGAAESVAARFRSVLGQLADDAAGRIGAVDVLLPAERDRLTGAPDGTEAGALSEQTLPALFERRAAATPDAVAVAFGDASLTYRELNSRANQLAYELIRGGAGPESVVGLAVPRGAHLAVALLGTLKSGAAYALADPASAEERAPGWASVVTQATVEALEPTGAGEANPGDADRVAPLLPRHLACVQGELAVGHQDLAKRVSRLAADAGVTPGARLLAASPGADAAAFEILAALCAGAAVEVVPDARALAERDGWTGEVICAPAPLLADLLNRSAGPIRAATVVSTGGTLPASLARRVSEAVPGARVIGLHGPAATAGAVVLAADPDGTEAGGAPLGTSRVRILDPALRPVPAGVTGELYVSEEPARGCHGSTALTARRFVAAPYGPPGTRMYRTGELARWHGDGRVEYVGQEGPLARIRGHRVRAAGVEAVLAEHPGVSQAAVVVRQSGGTDGEDQLVAHVVPLRTGGGADAEELRAYLAGRLPEYMAPAAFVTLEELPWTADGAVDRGALAEAGSMAGSGSGSAGGYRPGRTPQEEALCALFAEVLGVDRVGIDDNFFSLGVNSLKATRLIGRMRRTLGIEASIRTVFQYSTIAELSGQLRPATAQRKARPALRRRTENG